MTAFFLDTGAFVAYLVADDFGHEAAQATLNAALDSDAPLVTTNAVVFETYAMLLKRARHGRGAAVAFLDELEAGFCDIEYATRDDERRAWRLVRAHTDKNYSLCDALSFVVMERLGITDVISFDRYFREYGRFNVFP